jgi:hypothetical protein
MKPVGLRDPRTGRRPVAVVQLRQEDAGATAFNLVGFQTRMTWGEQARVLRMIPGLESAEFMRFGSVHRNTFVNAPEVLAPSLELRAAPGIYLAGQVTGVEGYLESAACGLLCAVNLALSIAAERDLQVLLIDADVARPSLQRELRLPEGPGLMDLLLDPSLPLEAAVRDTDIDKLAVMTAGTLSDNANELLASDAMEALLDLISERYPDRIFIFDAPPLLPTTEARVLAGLMGQIALIVEAGVTPQGAVEEALATIEACPVVGVILNKADERRAGGYGYGYGYGNGST